MVKSLIIFGGVFVLLLFLASLFAEQWGLPELPIIAWKDIAIFIIFVFLVVLIVREANRG